MAVFGFALIVQLLWLGTCNPYPHGDIVDVQYRRKERLAAFRESKQHPSPTAQATFDEELRRLRRHERIWMIVLLGVLLTANGVGIYYLFYGRKKTLA